MTKTQDRIVVSGLSILIAILFGSIINDVATNQFSDPLVMTAVGGIFALVIVGFVVVNILPGQGDSKIARQSRRSNLNVDESKRKKR